MLWEFFCKHSIYNRCFCTFTHNHRFTNLCFFDGFGRCFGPRFLMFFSRNFVFFRYRFLHWFWMPFWVHFGAKWSQNGSQNHHFWHPKSTLAPKSTLGCILVAFGLTFGSLLAPFGSLLAPFGTLWLPFGSLLAPFGSLLAPFCSLRAPFGSLWPPFSFGSLLDAPKHTCDGIVHKKRWRDRGFAAPKIIMG